MLFKNVDLYKFGNKLLVKEKNTLYFIGDGIKAEPLPLPVSFFELNLLLVSESKLIVWGDDGIGNTFYIYENEAWERIWLSETDKIVSNIILDKKKNLIIKLIDKKDNHLCFRIMVGKKLYKILPPREGFIETLELNEKCDKKTTVFTITQNIIMSLLVKEGELASPYTVKFTFESTEDGIKDGVFTLKTNISSVELIGNRYENIKIAPKTFKDFLESKKPLEKFVEIKDKTVNYEDFRINDVVVNPVDFDRFNTPNLLDDTLDGRKKEFVEGSAIPDIVGSEQLGDIKAPVWGQ